MTVHTTTVKLDLSSPRDFVYEADITSDVLTADIKRGRSGDFSQARVGTCKLKLKNASGDYTPKNAGSALFDTFHPMAGVEVASSAPAAADHFTGFIRKITVHPKGTHQYVTVDCADWLWVLSRVDVSLPLMRDVRPGNLIHRIVDLAEVGELVTNTRFRDDLTGWTTVGDATQERVTTGRLLHGSAAMDVVSTGAFSGSRHHFTAEIGAIVTGAAYVWAENDGDVGEDIRIHIKDDAGENVTLLTLTSEPQRVAVTRTIAGANPRVRVSRSNGGGAESFRVGAVHVVPTSNAIPRTFDDGVSIFAYIAPRRVNALRAIRECAENELGGWCYCDGSGTLIFEDRHHRWHGAAHTASQGTVTEVMTDLAYTEDAEDLLGRVEFGYAEWIEGEPGTQVWAADRLPIAIGPNGSETVEIDYGAIVRDAIKPVANTDWYANSQRDGGGADESGNITLTFEDWGAGGQATFANGVARTIYITAFVVRGTPVREASDTPQVSYTPSGAPDVASKVRYFYRIQSGRPHVEAWAEYLGKRYVTQRERLPVALVNKSNALLTQMLSRKLSERVTLEADASDYSPKIPATAYYIDAIEHHFSKGATLLRSKWEAVPVDLNFWILETGELEDAQSQTTTTAIGP